MKYEVKYFEGYTNQLAEYLERQVNNGWRVHTVQHIGQRQTSISTEFQMWFVLLEREKL